MFFNKTPKNYLNLIHLILMINSTKSTVIQLNCLINLKRTKKKGPIKK